MSKKYAALIFDVVGSRTLEDRLSVQRKIRDVIEFLNSVYGDSIEKEVVTASGDEFQGLFNNLADAYAYAHSLGLYLYPIRIRCGIGYGEVKYLEPTWQSTDIDGQAYYFAREAINMIKDKRSKDAIFIKTGHANDKMINTILCASAAVKRNEGDTAKLIELILDFTCPFSKNIKSKIRHKKSTFIKLLFDRLNPEKKENVMINGDNSKLAGHHSLEKIDIECEVEKLLSETNQDGNESMYTEYFPYGFASLITPLTMTTLQNVSNIINNNNIKEVRNIDGMIYDLLVKFDDKEGDKLCY